MQRFTNILLVCEPIGHALPALKRAVELARDNNAKLTLSNFRDDLPRTLLNLEKTFKKINLDLIVMGTVARTGIPGFLIGNTAEKILSTADSSILAVKPKLFSTPVK